MPVLLKGDCTTAASPATQEPRMPSDMSSLSCPAFSGHLLKLGLSGQWQSRLFSFDGNVLTCSGARTKPQAYTKSKTKDSISTAPHVASSATTCRRSVCISGKWSLELAAMTSIRLLSSSAKHVRCFPPYTGAPRTLSIQLTDGRNVYLRAKKDTDIERWFFTLFKIWSLQQQLYSLNANQEMIDVVPSGCTRAVSAVDALSDGEVQTKQPHQSRPVPARQQSLHLIHRYLSQRRQQRRSQPNQNKQEVEQEEQPLFPSKQEDPSSPVSNHNLQGSPHYHLIPLQALNATSQSSDVQSQYRIPAPPRISRFLPSGFDWDMKEDTAKLRRTRETADGTRDGDRQESKVSPVKRNGTRHRATSPTAQKGQPTTTSFWDANTVSYLREMPASQDKPVPPPLHETLKPQQATSRKFNGPASRPEEHQIFWPQIMTLAPEKAAAIDAWRRSLLSPLMMGDEGSYHSEDSENAAGRNKTNRPPHDSDSQSFEITVPERSQDSKPEIGARPNWPHPKDECTQSPLAAPASERVSYEACYLPMPGQSGANRPKHMHHYVSKDDSMLRKEPTIPVQRRASSHDLIVNQLRISHTNCLAPATDELPLGLLKLNRHSRWGKTQLSSDDGASAANRNSFPTHEALDALLPPAPITPKQSIRKVPFPTQDFKAMPSVGSKMTQNRDDEGPAVGEWATSNQAMSLQGPNSFPPFPAQNHDFVCPRPIQHPLSSRRSSAQALVHMSHSLDAVSRHLSDCNDIDPTALHSLQQTLSPPHSTNMSPTGQQQTSGLYSRDNLTRFWQQQQQQGQQSWLQWHQDGEDEDQDKKEDQEKEEEEEDDEEDENEPLAHTRTRRQMSILSIQHQQHLAGLSSPIIFSEPKNTSTLQISGPTAMSAPLESIHPFMMPTSVADVGAAVTPVSMMSPVQEALFSSTSYRQREQELSMSSDKNLLVQVQVAQCTDQVQVPIQLAKAEAEELDIEEQEEDDEFCYF
ncbi:hypothetical protein BG004_008036 [Podila humilis]|nr:hypothetical protein BG004_008036 [Podila humilis]